MGPVIHRANAERVNAVVADAAAYAHIIVLGGRVAERPFAGTSCTRHRPVERARPSRLR